MTRTRATLVLTACVAVAGLAVLTVPSSAEVTPSAHLLRPLAGPDSGTFPSSEVPVGDVDRRGPRLAPLAGAQARLDRLGRAGLNVSWTQFGTPLALTRDKGFLATGLTGSPEAVARTFLTTNRDLFGLSAADVSGLQLVTAGLLPDSKTAWSVQFRQLHKGIALAEDGMVSVAHADGKVALVTSSLVPTNLLGQASTTPTLSVKDAVLAAARNVGVTTLDAGDLTIGKLASGGFTTVSAKGLHQLQRTRLRMLATTDQGARLVYETNITDVAGGRALAAIGFVDARNGAVLLRRDAVDTLAESTQAHAGQRSISTAAAAGQGAYATTFSKTACGAPFTIEVAPGDASLAITASAANPTNDIIIKVLRNNVEIASIDTLASPEAGTATFSPPITASDVVTGKICPYDNLSEAPFEVAGNYMSSDQGVPRISALPPSLSDGTATGPATFRGFGSNPAFPATSAAAPDSRYLACSGAPNPANNIQNKDLSDCEFVFTDGSPLPYDSDPLTGMSTFTTLGNNALTSDARASSSLTPGGPFLPPASPTRDYEGAWTDAWHSSQCDPASIVGPAQSDVMAAIVNLNLGHNRTHDFAYRLGLNEPRGALQTSNFGSGTGAELDPEIGNAQNAALSNGAFDAANSGPGPAGDQVPLTGRNNANQITLQDGVPGITNQYLFQPVVGFAGPCADGDLDASIFLHEYTHAISNRLVGGPDTGLSGYQGGSMGESWSDLVAVEYLNAFGLAGKGGEDPYSVGSYATGDKIVGIRDYNLAPSKNPLNYSNLGFDSTGPEVHADGEVWNAAQMEIRQALIKKYDAQYPSTNMALQRDCAVGRTPSGAAGPAWNKCPGNRRYVTYLFDAMINQANGSPSMVDMKNVELAGVMLRDAGDWDLVANAFAVRGLGRDAKSKNTADTDPTPSFASPTTANNATVTFQLVDELTGKAVKGSVFVGMYHARCVPVATTLGGTAAKPTATLMKGKYTFTVQARGYGIQRFTSTFAPGTKTQVFKLAQNVASSAFGPTVSGNEGALRVGRAFDDSETSTAAFDAQPVAGREITVKFGGGKQTFQRLGVSSLHHVPEKLPEGGTEFTGRLLGIRAFDIQASNNGGRSFTTIYKSPANFFPANAPRAVAPDLIMREIRLANPVTADTVRLVIRGNTCTGNPAFAREQEVDPTSPSDCSSVATNTTRVTVTELQVLRGALTAPAVTRPVAVPPVAGGAGPTGPLAATGGNGGLALGGLVLLTLVGIGVTLRRRT